LFKSVDVLQPLQALILLMFEGIKANKFKEFGKKTTKEIS